MVDDTNVISTAAGNLSIFHDLFFIDHNRFLLVMKYISIKEYSGESTFYFTYWGIVIRLSSNELLTHGGETR